MLLCFRFAFFFAIMGCDLNAANNMLVRANTVQLMYLYIDYHPSFTFFFHLYKAEKPNGNQKQK